MTSSALPMKRSSSALEAAENKRPKHHYYHHHRLHEPITLPSGTEPALQDDSNIDQLMNRSLGQLLRDAGYELADPAALASLRSSAEEYLSRLSSYVRQSMLSARRIQPIPHDFEHALKRGRVSTGDLEPYIKPSRLSSSMPTLLPSPPPEDEVSRKLPFLNALRVEESESNRSYVPKHFPDFPSKHTYSTTAVFTERDSDPRKIRERAAEDGRHGEEALRNLASAAFRDNSTSSSGRDKRLWGRRAESMETMFDKTVKSLAKKLQKDALGNSTAGIAMGSDMEIDSGIPADADGKGRFKAPGNLELGPTVNCERDLWRRTTSANAREAEDKTSKSAGTAEPVDGVMAT
ncbi:hypothetical protein N7532_002124 [Penicillium argentinense]|uniref:Transcription initiation factor TFIID subunit 8 n=1 Tax=Penicillium argentinense TaxID=1131581 RepID=A0A9W9G3W4_9EURO|nr:uncharacterized protein N7532_002124 [Penicillium argentinense]KAJ5111589.1 hypothetical protein N7532_002124 [Penicillium argentinense]